MATVTLKGKEVHTIGALPAMGSRAPDFRLVRGDLSDARLADFAGKTKILNISPSLDTSVCALSAKRFDAEVGKFANVVLMHISADLPFAATRFCKAEGLQNLVSLSQMRDHGFGKDYGVELIDGPMAGLLSRAVIVLDGADKVVYAELVAEITHEPDYDAALAAVRALR